MIAGNDNHLVRILGFEQSMVAVLAGTIQFGKKVGSIQLIVTIGIGNAIDTFSANGSVKRITFPEQPMRSREIDRQLLYLG